MTAAAEVAFEYLAGALESVKGTAIAAPTHYLNMAGVITPKQERWRPDESRGTLAATYRSAVLKQWSELSADGPLDTLTLPFLLEMCVKGAGVITTPGGGTNSRLHTYAPTMTADDLKSATVFWGDPNTQIFQSAYNMLDSIVLSGDAGAAGGVTQAIKGQGRFPAKLAAPALPAQLNAPLIAASDMQLWIDSASAIGTTEITGRVVSGEVTIPSGNTYKWLASGPTGGKNFQRHGRKKRQMEIKLVFELADMVQYDLWAAATSLKVRLQYNGPIIEGALRHFVQCDCYGPFDTADWGTLEESNRTIAMTILSEYNSVAGFDWQIVVQNDRATI